MSCNPSSIIIKLGMSCKANCVIVKSPNTLTFSAPRIGSSCFSSCRHNHDRWCGDGTEAEPRLLKERCNYSHNHDRWCGDPHKHDKWCGDPHNYDRWCGDPHSHDRWCGDPHNHDIWCGDGTEPRLLEGQTFWMRCNYPYNYILSVSSILWELGELST